MARIVEICGAPGVGKSAIYAEVLSKWKKYHNWVPGFLLYPGKKITLTTPTAMIQTLVHRLRHVPDAGVMKKAGEEFVAQNAKYVDACWNNIFFRRRGEAGRADVRFHAADYWLKTFQKIQVLRQSSSPKLALIDEGLIQRIDSALFESNTWEQEKAEIARLLDIMVLPHALIYIETDFKENISRLQKRKKVIALHKNLPAEKMEDLIRDYQQRWNFVCGLLIKKNIQVLSINSSNSIEQNAAAIVHFLNEIHLSDPHSVN